MDFKCIHMFKTVKRFELRLWIKRTINLVLEAFSFDQDYCVGTAVLHPTYRYEVVVYFDVPGTGTDF